MKTIPILKTDVEISALAKRLGAEASIAIDLEADSLHNYREKICLIQISTKDRTVLIDPLAGASLEPLKPLLANPAIIKIFHAADYDLRSLKRDYDLNIHGLFDTMISAQFAGEEKIGLADLLLKYFDVTLDKSFQKADWSMRPLSPEMIQYAASDTSYLHQLKDLLTEQLETLGRLGWVNEEFAILEDVRFADNGGPLCLRIKGAGTLSRRELGILEKLLQWRESEAEKRNRPVYKVIGNKTLLELARRMPQNNYGLRGIEGLPARLIDRYGERLLANIAAGKKVPDSELPVFPKQPRKPRDPRRDERLKKLKQWREQEAKHFALDPGVLINNTALEGLALANPKEAEALNKLDCLKNWQKEVLGDNLLKVLVETDNA